MYLEFERIRMMTHPREHGHGMMKDEASALNTLIDPARLMLLFINWNGESLATTIIYSIYNRDIKFLWMLSQVMST